MELITALLSFSSLLSLFPFTWTWTWMMVLVHCLSVMDQCKWDGSCLASASQYEGKMWSHEQRWVTCICNSVLPVHEERKKGTILLTCVVMIFLAGNQKQHWYSLVRFILFLNLIFPMENFKHVQNRIRNQFTPHQSSVTISDAFSNTHLWKIATGAQRWTCSLHSSLWFTPVHSCN